MMSFLPPSLVFLWFVLFPPQSTGQDQFVLEPIKDNTLIEDFSGEVSNGAGPFVFAGRVGPNSNRMLRRAVLQFDLSALPLLPDQIKGAALSFFVSLPERGGVQPFTLHRLSGPWGEGASSNTGGVGDTATRDDATWLHSFYADQFWESPGGDFFEVPSGEINMEGRGQYVFSDFEGMLADIKHWMANPEDNFGWILRGNEAGGTTVKRLGSRENEDPELRPRLTVFYEGDPLPVVLSAFEAVISGRDVHLFWRTESEQNNAGFEVQLASNSGYQAQAFVRGNGTTVLGTEYEYVLNEVLPGDYRVRLKQVDFDGRFEFSPVLNVRVKAVQAVTISVYPNPTNAQFQIEIHVPVEQHVSIILFDLLGRHIKEIYSGTLARNQLYLFRSQTDDLPSGIYMLRSAGKYFIANEALVLMN